MDEQLHLLLFPWLAHGHISPYLELSKRLAEHNGIHISFLSTPHNISKLKPLFPDQGKGKVQLVELPLPPVQGLLPGIENTTDLPTEQMSLLLKATDSLQEPFEKLLQNLSPDCVVYDILQSWTAKSAAKFGIPAIYFTTYGAAYYAYDFNPARGETDKITAEDLTRPPRGYPSSTISWRLSEAKSRLSLYNYRIGDLTMRDRVMNCYEGCSAMAIKSCEELEGLYIHYLESTTGKTILPLGPLVANNSPQAVFSISVSDENHSLCLRWLNKQAPASVVYVSFGSEYFLSKEQIEEIVLGLEASQQPFICVLRLPCYMENDFQGDQQTRVSALLPDGFEDRIRDRGLVVGGWVHQREILGHPCTGSFVTHCGWSSILEGMSLGLPLIALPMQLDQALNARLIVEEFKVGVEVDRGENCELRKEEICKAVRRIMVERAGKEVRSKALEMANIFRSRILNEGSEGSQNRCIHEFIKYLNCLKASLGICRKE